jgi:hypothetical protein
VLDEDILYMSFNNSGEILITGGSKSLTAIDVFNKNTETRVCRRDNRSEEVDKRRSSIRTVATDPLEQCLFVSTCTNHVMKYSRQIIVEKLRLIGL